VLRYDSSVRLLLSLMYLLMTVRSPPSLRMRLHLTLLSLLQLLFTPLVIYVPALAFAQVSGLNMYLVATVTCAICIFYTSLVSFSLTLYKALC
jgi:hypothetical protein